MSWHKKRCGRSTQTVQSSCPFRVGVGLEDSLQYLEFCIVGLKNANMHYFVIKIQKEKQSKSRIRVYVKNLVH